MIPNAEQFIIHAKDKNNKNPMAIMFTKLLESPNTWKTLFPHLIQGASEYLNENVGDNIGTVATSFVSLANNFFDSFSSLD